MLNAIVLTIFRALFQQKWWKNGHNSIAVHCPLERWKIASGMLMSFHDMPLLKIHDDDTESLV